MAIDWNDNTKRKRFRLALQEVYPSDVDLEIFIAEKLDENLAVVAGGDNLQVRTYYLVNWAKAKDRLNELYEAFKLENYNHPFIKELEAQSEKQAVVN